MSCVLTALLSIGLLPTSNARGAEPHFTDKPLFDINAALRHLEAIRRDKHKENRTPPAGVSAPGRTASRPGRFYELAEELDPKELQSLQAIRADFEHGKVKRALKDLHRLRDKTSRPKKFGDPFRRYVPIELLLVEIQLKQEQTRDALETLEPIGRATGDYQSNDFDRHYLIGSAHLKAGDGNRALRKFDQMAGAENGGDWLKQALAAEGVCLAHLLLNHPEPALDAIRYALRALGEHRKELRYLNQHERLATADKLEKRFREAYERVLRLHEIEKYGEAFVLYRDGERLRRTHKRYAEARAKYGEAVDRFPDSPYTDACRYYKILCLREMGAKLSGVERLLRQFIAADRFGLYRGEAMLELGRIALEVHVNPRLADRAFEDLDRWLAEARKPQHAVKLPPIKPEAVPKTRPPKVEYSKADFWGNTRRHAITPGILLNRATSAWYLDDIEEQCAKFRGFLFFTEGEQADALAQYRRILKLDPHASDGSLLSNPNDYTRLKFGAENGYLYAYPQDLKMFTSRRQRTAVLLGDFYYVTRAFGKSREVARRLLEGDFGRLAPAQRDYVQFLFASAVYWLEGRGSAYPEYLKVLATREGTFSEVRATYAAGNVAVNSQDKALNEQGRRLWLNLIESRQKGEYFAKAHLGLAIAYRDQDKDVAKAIRLLEAFPDDDPSWSKTIAHYRDLFKRELEAAGNP